MSDRNFIIAKLGDNDFGRKLLNGFEHAVKEYGFTREGSTLEEWKSFVIGYVVGMGAIDQSARMYRKIDWDNLKHIEGYLMNNLELSYATKPLHEDHDHGSVCLNLYTFDGWTF